jgi:hypothetical protein
MSRDIDRLALQRSFEPPVLDPDGKAPEQHVPHRHLVDDRIEPIDEQQFEVRPFTLHLDGIPQLHRCMGHDGGQCVGCVLERFRGRGPETTNADVGIVRKMFPAGAGLRRRS